MKNFLVTFLLISIALATLKHIYLDWKYSSFSCSTKCVASSLGYLLMCNKLPQNLVVFRTAVIWLVFGGAQKLYPESFRATWLGVEYPLTPWLAVAKSSSLSPSLLCAEIPYNIVVQFQDNEVGTWYFMI